MRILFVLGVRYNFSFLPIRSGRLRAICSHPSSGRAEICLRRCSTTGQVVSTGSFQYTLDNPKLSYEHRKFYEENGFLIIKKLVQDEELEKYREEFVRICKGGVAIGRMSVMKDVAIDKSEFVADEQAVTKIQNFAENEVLFRYCCLPEVVDYVECFTGPNVISIHTMLINKPPDPGKKTSRHPLHQDMYYFPFRPADRIVGSWTAMQHVHRENGCLVVFPGSHRGGEILEHGYPEWEGGVNIFYHGIKTYDCPDEGKRVYLEMQTGDTVFFHPLLIHGSGMNRTTGFRKSISCHYAGSDCHYIDITGTAQQTMADEMEKYVNERDDVNDMKYEYRWKTKTKLVRGNENSLGW